MILDQSDAVDAAELPSLVTAEKPVTEWLQPVRDNLGVFRTVGVGRTAEGKANEVEFVPFYRLHRRTYSVYWDLYTDETWTRKIEELADGTRYATEVGSSDYLVFATRRCGKREGFRVEE